MPQCGGWCAFGMSIEDKFPVDPTKIRIVDGKLYLFRTAESRREFKRQPLRYTRVQHAVKSTELTGQTFH